MADFVDNFFGNSFDDPKSQAVMALASGLMGGDWRKGVNGYLGAMGTAGEYNAKKQLQQAQMQEMMVKAAAEKQKMEMDAKKNKMLMDMLGGGQPSQASSSGLLGDSAPQGGLLGGGAQGGSDPFAGVDKRALMLDYLQNGGKNMGGWINDNTKPKWENINGYLVNTNAPNFNGGFQPGMKASDGGPAIMWQPDGKGGLVAGAVPGALDTFAAFESIKAGNKPIQVYNPTTGRMDYETEGNVVKAAKSGTPKPMSAPSTAPSNGSNSGYWGGSKESGLASRLEVLQSEINNPKNSPANRAAAQRELTQTQIDLQRIRPTQGAQSGAFAAAPSQQEKDQQKLTSENAGKVNDVWLKSSYTPLVESKGALTGTIDSINQSRAAMNAMGGTGWGTETKAAAASVLTGLGIGGKNAEMYATNAQTFQQAAMTRLQAELQQQKGPQTEGDSTRQAATYAALKNTPQANAYLLDSAQAKAERDLMKARFYESALPIASKKGDLQEIDREWNKRAPSLFSMPSMQKWVKK